MIADRFHNRRYTGISHTEAFASHAVDVDFTAGGTVEGNIPDDDVFGCDEGGFWRGVEDDFTAAQTFADVVIGIAFEFEGYALGDECTEALSCTTLEFEVDGIFGESIPVVFGDFITQNGTDGAVDVGNWEGEFDRFAVFNCTFTDIQ